MSEEIFKKKGPLLVLAGPGTGKTYQLARRVKYLIEDLSCEPNCITVITFTVAAALNMRNRLSDSSKSEIFVYREKQPPLICTMHSLGYKIIKDNANAIGYKKDTLEVIGSEHIKNILLGDAAQLTTNNRANASLVKDCREKGICKPNVNELKCSICVSYRDILLKCNCVDYDDQIILACELLRKNPYILSNYQNNCKHLLVDEFQDINPTQFDLIKLLSENSLTGLFAVGDDDQSIYSWRGASPKYLREFKSFFGDNSKIEVLNKSYRCNPYILNAATAIVKKYDMERLDKNINEFEINDGCKVNIHSVASDDKETNIITNIIVKKMYAKSVLILIPQWSFAKDISASLKKWKINVTIPSNDYEIHGFHLLQKLFQWLNKPNDSLALRLLVEFFIENTKVSNVPKRCRTKVNGLLPKGAVNKIKNREQAFQELSSLWTFFETDKIASYWESIQANKEKTQLFNLIFETFKSIENLGNDENSMGDFLKAILINLKPWVSQHKLYEELNSLISNEKNVSPDTNVQIVTYQMAKGLEADVVIIVGAEEGTIPNFLHDNQLDEQSRLMFVAMTRAKEELHIFHARKRYSFKVKRDAYSDGYHLARSRFLDDIPKELILETYHKVKKTKKTD